MPDLRRVHSQRYSASWSPGGGTQPGVMRAWLLELWYHQKLLDRVEDHRSPASAYTQVVLNERANLVLTAQHKGRGTRKPLGGLPDRGSKAIPRPGCWPHPSFLALCGLLH